MTNEEKRVLFTLLFIMKQEGKTTYDELIADVDDDDFLKVCEKYKDYITKRKIDD